MTDGPGQCLWRALVRLVGALGYQTRVLAAPALHEHLSLIAHKNDAVFRIQDCVLPQFGGTLWQQAAIVPVQLHRRHISPRGELVMHDCCQRDGFCEYRRGARLHSVGRAQFERRKHGGKVMNAHVPEAARSEIPPTGPAERDVGRMIGPNWRRAEPQVPIQRIRNLGSIFGSLDALGPPQRHLAAMRWPIGPDMHFAHGANRACPQPLIDETVALEGHALVAHLRCYFGSPRGFGHCACLIDCARQRFLAINVFAMLYGRH